MTKHKERNVVDGHLFGIKEAASGKQQLHHGTVGYSTAMCDHQGTCSAAGPPRNPVLKCPPHPHPNPYSSTCRPNRRLQMVGECTLHVGLSEAHRSAGVALCVSKPSQTHEEPLLSVTGPLLLSVGCPSGCCAHKRAISPSKTQKGWCCGVWMPVSPLTAMHSPSPCHDDER